MAGLIFGTADPELQPERPERVLVYGDSLSWSRVPQRTFIPSERFPPEMQWPKVMGAMLGQGHEVVVDAMSGRTTDTDDPPASQIPGVGTNGNRFVRAADKLFARAAEPAEGVVAAHTRSGQGGAGQGRRWCETEPPVGAAQREGRAWSACV